MPRNVWNGDPASIFVADVINIYCTDVATKINRPSELGQRAAALLSFFASKTLAEINGSLCRAYVARRQDPFSMARHELEDLRAAINHHRKEGLCNAIVEVLLPPRARRVNDSTRSEAAKMIWAAWRYREAQKGHLTGRRSRKHIARFMLVALYTGTRSARYAEPRSGPQRAAVTSTSTRACSIGERQADRNEKATADDPLTRQAPRPSSPMEQARPCAEVRDRVRGKAGRPVRGRSQESRPTPKVKDVTPHVLRHTAVTWAMQNWATVMLLPTFSV